MMTPKRLQVPRVLPGSSASKKAAGELSEYESYYAVVRKIPRGRVMTYGDVAKLAGRPTSARRVGYALFVCSGTAIPWWRVLNARGGISARHLRYPGGPEDEQRFRLLEDGIEFSADGRVDLAQYRHLPGAQRRTSRSSQSPRRRSAPSV